MSARAETPPAARARVLTPRVRAAFTRVALTVLLLGLASPPAQLAAQRVPPPLSSRADELLSAGRLAAAEQVLYAAVEAAPRQPAPRGALALYLASRARFRIAEVLFQEALRFGADTALVARALVLMAPYRAPADLRGIPGVRLPSAIAAREETRARHGYVFTLAGPEATVPIELTEDGRTLARFEARGPYGPVWVTLDPAAEGVSIRSIGDSSVRALSFGGRGPGAPVLIEELWIGPRRLTWLDATIDPTVPPGELRIGLDVLWRFHPIFDERTGTMTLPRVTALPTASAAATRVPFVLRFPGLSLVPVVGQPPFAIEGPEGRAFLRGARWQIDPTTSTVIVER